MKYTSPSQAGVIVSCLPLIVAVLAFFMLKERLSRAIMLGFTLCISGSLLLTWLSPVSEHASNPLLGNGLELLAMLCAAYYSVSVKYLASRYSPISLIALQGVSGSVFFAPFLPFITIPTEHDPIAFAHILYLGTFVTFGAYGMYNYALSKVSVLTAAAYSNLIPIFTLILSALILSEVLTLWQWASIGVVFVGVLVSQRHQALVVDFEDEPTGTASTNKRQGVPAANDSNG